MALNEALYKARKDSGFTLEEMAHLIGYKSKVTYYYIENNKTEVTLKTASEISNILKEPIEKLFPNFFMHEVQDTQTYKKNHEATGTIGQ